jgi:hypothetical protein
MCHALMADGSDYISGYRQRATPDIQTATWCSCACNHGSFSAAAALLHIPTRHDYLFYSFYGIYGSLRGLGRTAVDGLASTRMGLMISGWEPAGKERHPSSVVSSLALFYESMGNVQYLACRNHSPHAFVPMCVFLAVH